MEISLLVRRCLDKFKALSVSDTQHLGRIVDEYGRFRVWAGNVSAHTSGRRSLQHRLRDSSELSKAVIKHPNELLGVLNDVSDAASGNEADDSSSEGAFDEEDHDLFEMGDPESHDLQALEEVGEIISCLMRISMALRNPARNDQIRYAETALAKLFEPRDIEHVRMKFPCTSERVARRLGKSISRHRQYFKYRKEHHEKLSHGIDMEGEHDEEKQSTAATSLVHPENQQNVSTSTYDESDMESVGTATSYAQSQTGDSALRPPSRPSTAKDELPFECTICYHIVNAPNERLWRQHVYEDLPPYVCLYEDCKAATHQFSRRREWRNHMQEHFRYWICPYSCQTTFDTSSEHQEHLRSVHAEHLNERTMTNLSESCARDNKTSSSQCPFCDQEKPTQNAWFKHVGHHLEQLALFSLPKYLLSHDSDDENDDHLSDSDVERMPEYELLSDGEAELDLEKETREADSEGYIDFVDLNGRTFKYPLQLCKTWIGMDTLIRQHPHEDEDRVVVGEDWVRQGYYILTSPDGVEIRPHEWTSVVRHGLKVMLEVHLPHRQERPAPLDDILDDHESDLSTPYRTTADESGPETQQENVSKWEPRNIADQQDETDEPGNMTEEEYRSVPAKFDFIDGFGKRHSLPWQIYKSWKNMEQYIGHIFRQNDGFDDHVRKGRYDLIGSDGEIVTAQVWDMAVQPDSEINMNLWFPLPLEHLPKLDTEGESSATLMESDNGDRQSLSGAFIPPATRSSSDRRPSISNETYEGLDRNHPLYSEGAHADGLYHCPFKGSSPSCQHKPTKLKSDYDKFIDSHLGPPKTPRNVSPVDDERDSGSSVVPVTPDLIDPFDSRSDEGHSNLEREQDRADTTRPTSPPRQRRESGHGEDQTMEQEPTLDEALTFLDSVRVRFKDDPVAYNRFLDILSNFRSGSIDAKGVKSTVNALFAGQPELMNSFEAFFTRMRSERENRVAGDERGEVEAGRPEAEANYSGRTGSAGDNSEATSSSPASARSDSSPTGDETPSVPEPSIRRSRTRRYSGPGENFELMHDFQEEDYQKQTPPISPDVSGNDANPGQVPQHVSTPDWWRDGKAVLHNDTVTEDYQRHLRERGLPLYPLGPAARSVLSQDVEVVAGSIAKSSSSEMVASRTGGKAAEAGYEPVPPRALEEHGEEQSAVDHPIHSPSSTSQEDSIQAHGEDFHDKSLEHQARYSATQMLEVRAQMLARGNSADVATQPAAEVVQTLFASMEKVAELVSPFDVVGGEDQELHKGSYPAQPASHTRHTELREWPFNHHTDGQNEARSQNSEAFIDGPTTEQNRARANEGRRRPELTVPKAPNQELPGSVKLKRRRSEVAYSYGSARDAQARENVLITAIREAEEARREFRRVRESFSGSREATTVDEADPGSATQQKEHLPEPQASMPRSQSSEHGFSEDIIPGSMAPSASSPDHFATYEDGEDDVSGVAWANANEAIEAQHRSASANTSVPSATLGPLQRSSSPSSELSTPAKEGLTDETDAAGKTARRRIELADAASAVMEYHIKKDRREDTHSQTSGLREMPGSWDDSGDSRPNVIRRQRGFARSGASSTQGSSHATTRYSPEERLEGVATSQAISHQSDRPGFDRPDYVEPAITREKWDEMEERLGTQDRGKKTTEKDRSSEKIRKDVELLWGGIGREIESGEEIEEEEEEEIEKPWNEMFSDEWLRRGMQHKQEKRIFGELLRREEEMTAEAKREVAGLEDGWRKEQRGKKIKIEMAKEELDDYARRRVDELFREAMGSTSQEAHTWTACTRCRQRKSRCDPQLPRCSPCERTNSTCEYYDSTKGRIVNRSYIVGLQERQRGRQGQQKGSTTRGSSL